uniref:Glycosyl transferase family 1 domain-containing protein n=1 Tax=Globisporangium ultimum (strain ATCC 200006 / CBS 805.95 / DAOM BR144) TaxID=431595 RepID=K3WTA9_GLOUD
MTPPPSPSPADATTKPTAPSTSSNSTWTLRKSLTVALGALVALVVWSIGAEYSVLATARSSFLSVILSASDVDADDAASVEFYPKEVFETDWAAKIPDAEQLHLLALHSACVKHKDSVIPWHFGLSGNDENDDATRNPEQVLVNEDDPDLLEKLRQCPDVDVFLPAGIRSFGYCEDAAAYTKFLQSRMLPAWVATVAFHDAERNHTFTYHDLCPNTPMLFFNHYWDGVPTSPSWPPTKPLYLMPNIEMYELQAEHYWKADVVLCKTAICARYLNKWFRQEGNPKNTQVMYTRHTTSNVALAVREQIGDDAIAPKNFSNVRFTHTAGTSIQKGTSRILDCWLKRPHFPPVDVYIAEQLYKNDFKSRFDEAIQKAENVNLHVGKLDTIQFGKVIAEGSFFLCPSFQEGYGHYINQARASGGVIVTTDVAPMNELITRDSGVLIHSEVYGFKEQFLGGKSEHPHALWGVQGFVADLRGENVCASIDAMLSENTPRDYEEMAQRAHQQFLFDTIFFAQKMQELREFARAKSHHYLRKEPASAIP